jgi:RNA polymerase sigma-70 factor (ECF subfamily)
LTDVSAETPRPGEVDLQLVQRTVAGDQKAFELLVIKYQRRIERLIGRMVRDVDLVEDIAQETFIRAYRALHQFRGDAQFYTWLYRIAVNTAKKALVDMKRDPTISESAMRPSSEEDDELTAPETNQSATKPPNRSWRRTKSPAWSRRPWTRCLPNCARRSPCARSRA